MIRCLKQQLEGEVEIHFLTKKKFATIFEANPYLTAVHSFDENISEVMPLLQEEGFDYVVDLHHNIRSQLVKRRLKTLNFTFNKVNFQKWLLVNLKINRLPSLHVVDRYFETVKPLGVKNDGKGLDYFIPPIKEIDVSFVF